MTLHASGRGLQVENLSAGYGSDSDEFVVFKDVSFEVLPGEILAIFGPNGSGKSTIVKSLVGLNSRSTGSINYNGADVNLAKIGYVPQDFRSTYFSWTSLYGNVALAQSKYFSARSEAESRSDELKEIFGIDVDFNLRPHQCSGGMLQQSALVRAFYDSPNLIFADEPFSALDFSIAKSLKANVSEMIAKDRKSMIAVLHNLDDIIDVADKVLVLPECPFSTSDENELPKARILTNNKKKKSDHRVTNDFIEFAENLLR